MSKTKYIQPPYIPEGKLRRIFLDIYNQLNGLDLRKRDRGESSTYITHLNDMLIAGLASQGVNILSREIGDGESVSRLYMRNISRQFSSSDRIRVVNKYNWEGQIFVAVSNLMEVEESEDEYYIDVLEQTSIFLPVGSFCHIDAAMISLSMMASNSTFRIMAESNAIGEVIQDAFPGDTELKVNLWGYLSGGDVIDVLKEKIDESGMSFYEKDTFVVSEDQERYDSGIQDLPIFGSVKDLVRQGSYIKLNNVSLSSRFHIDPGRIWGVVTRDVKNDSIGVIDDDYESGQVYDEIYLSEIKSSYSLLDNDVMTIRNNNGDEEDVLVRGDQKLNGTGIYDGGIFATASQVISIPTSGIQVGDNVNIKVTYDGVSAEGNSPIMGVFQIPLISSLTRINVLNLVNNPDNGFRLLAELKTATSPIEFTSRIHGEGGNKPVVIEVTIGNNDTIVINVNLTGGEDGVLQDGKGILEIHPKEFAHSYVKNYGWLVGKSRRYRGDFLLEAGRASLGATYREYLNESIILESEARLTLEADFNFAKAELEASISNVEGDLAQSVLTLESKIENDIATATANLVTEVQMNGAFATAQSNWESYTDGEIATAMATVYTKAQVDTSFAQAKTTWETYADASSANAVIGLVAEAQLADKVANAGFLLQSELTDNLASALIDLSASAEFEDDMAEAGLITSVRLGDELDNYATTTIFAELNDVVADIVISVDEIEGGTITMNGNTTVNGNVQLSSGGMLSANYHGSVTNNLISFSDIGSTGWAVDSTGKAVFNDIRVRIGGSGGGSGNVEWTGGRLTPTGIHLAPSGNVHAQGSVIRWGASGDVQVGSIILSGEAQGLTINAKGGFYVNVTGGSEAFSVLSNSARIILGVDTHYKGQELDARFGGQGVTYSAGAGLSLSSNQFSLDGTVRSIHDIASATNGILVKTGSTSAAARSLVAGTGISITNANGVSGNITITCDVVNTDTTYSVISLADLENPNHQTGRLITGQRFMAALKHSNITGLGTAATYSAVLPSSTSAGVIRHNGNTRANGRFYNHADAPDSNHTTALKYSGSLHVSQIHAHDYFFL